MKIYLRLFKELIVKYNLFFFVTNNVSANFNEGNEQNNTDNIYHYGSNIIDASLEQVWNYITRFEFFKSKKEIKINITGNPECVGSIITY